MKICKCLRQVIKDIEELQKVCVKDMKDKDIRKDKTLTSFFEGHLCACEDLFWRIKDRLKEEEMKKRR